MARWTGTAELLLESGELVGRGAAYLKSWKNHARQQRWEGTMLTEDLLTLDQSQNLVLRLAGNAGREGKVLVTNVTIRAMSWGSMLALLGQGEPPF